MLIRKLATFTGTGFAALHGGKLKEISCKMARSMILKATLLAVPPFTLFAVVARRVATSHLRRRDRKMNSGIAVGTVQVEDQDKDFTEILPGVEYPTTVVMPHKPTREYSASLVRTETPHSTSLGLSHSDLSALSLCHLDAK
jgi:hypothetical protein